MSVSRPVKALGCLGLIFFIILLVLVVLYNTMPFLLPQYIVNAFGSVTKRSFSEELWKKKYNVAIPIRQNMMVDLLKKYDLNTMTMKEIEDLLGKPEANRVEDNVRTFHYYLGPRTTEMSIEPEELIIKFDKNGKVIEYKIIR